ncbi:hypothetical protein PQR05_29220 [Paraburkholderia sediminicola]|uniref:hypothetical protein n=1 Tax=Paraburkholderia sediminicola TaxID=458836 RepID=UPI0038BD3EA8
MPLPDHTPPWKRELRELWRACSQADSQRLILEILHYRNVLAQIEAMRLPIDRAWKADVGGQLVGLECLRVLLQQERVRVGIMDDIGGSSPPPIEPMYEDL